VKHLHISVHIHAAVHSCMCMQIPRAPSQLATMWLRQYLVTQPPCH